MADQKPLQALTPHGFWRWGTSIGKGSEDFSLKHKMVSVLEHKP